MLVSAYVMRGSVGGVGVDAGGLLAEDFFQGVDEGYVFHGVAAAEVEDFVAGGLVGRKESACRGRR